MLNLQKHEPIILLAIGTLCLSLSGIRPYDRLTWAEEIFPALLGAFVLVVTFHRFRFTPFIYRLVLLHAIILMIGGHYSYARVPAGFWVQNVFHLARNPYDRLGHFAQGFVPALITREVLLRRSPLMRGKWLFFLVVCVCLALSACYEFVEWWTALVEGSAANDFLGTQGDPWDTQWDMFMAFFGAILAPLTLGKLHDRQLARMFSSMEP